MAEIWASLVAAWVLGVLGAGHCFAMCGGIVAALSFAAPEASAASRFILNLAYNLGRIFSYALVGAIAATIAAALPTTGLPIARTIAGLLLLAMGLYVAGWWRGLIWLEKGGQVVWRHLKPLSDRCLPLDTAPKALVVGMVWGWLPCGLVYAALGYAAVPHDAGVAANAVVGAATMLAFGLGTLPALLAGGVFAARLKRALAKPGVRLVLALAYLLFGIWTLMGAWYHHVAHGAAVGDTDPAHQQHHH